MQAEGKTVGSGKEAGKNHKKPRFKRGNIKNGGPDKDRTCDLLHAMQALSQLSYRPFLLLIYYNSFFVNVQQLPKTEKARKGLFCG